MSLKTLIMPHVTARITGQEREQKRREKAERKRLKAGKDHIVEFFHDPSDPYSQLLKTALASFVERYRVQLLTHLVSPPDDGAAPERERLAAYAKIDAERLSKKSGISVDFKDHALASGTAAADARRKKLGHYLGGMLHYGGEWYWGLDRLHYLEQRLTELGLSTNMHGSAFIYTQPDAPVSRGKTGATLHWYLSFRSPYTAIVRDRVKKLADAYEAELKLRFVLPMVMRGLPVPPAKRTYIPLDTAREARRLGVAFGRIIDPVGRPVELGYSLIPWARAQGRGYEFVQAFLSSVWAEGVDAGSKSGMRKIVERADLDWSDAKQILGNDDWRAEAEANRTEMMDYGIWGVPSFRLGKLITWGQDRLWVMEDEFRKSLAQA